MARKPVLGKRMGQKYLAVHIFIEALKDLFAAMNWHGLSCVVL